MMPELGVELPVGIYRNRIGNPIEVVQCLHLMPMGTIEDDLYYKAKDGEKSFYLIRKDGRYTETQECGFDLVERIKP